jgi:hypothetical protein
MSIITYLVLSEWTKEDGYHECLLKTENGAELLRLRAVLNSNGLYSALIRSFPGTGEMLISKPGTYDLNRAKLECLDLLRWIVNEQIIRDFNIHADKAQLACHS